MGLCLSDIVGLLIFFGNHIFDICFLRLDSFVFVTFLVILNDGWAVEAPVLVKSFTHRFSTSDGSGNMSGEARELEL